MGRSGEVRIVERGTRRHLDLRHVTGQPDPAGITEFAVGTGGRDSQGFGTVVANSQVRKNQIFGVMKLTLRPAGYDWQFVPDPATPFADSGTGSCN